jgi:hypothetical protein
VTDYLDQLGRLAFDGITIPYQRIKIRGGVRDHVHEYPKVPGGLAEPLGRKLYEISITARIDEGIARAGGYYRGRNLITNANVLMGKFEREEVGPLHLPNIGEIRAKATSWERDLDVKIRSGELFDMQFREDGDAAHLTAATLHITSPTTIAQHLGAVEARSPTPQPDLLKSLVDAVNSVLAYRDQADMYQTVFAAKIEGLLALCREIDSALSELNDPLNHELLESLQNLWAAIRSAGAQARFETEMGTFITPRDMDCAAISIAIWGDTAHARDVLSLNALEDPYNVPAGTVIKFFRETPPAPTVAGLYGQTAGVRNLNAAALNPAGAVG